jgi:hypothetical protein
MGEADREIGARISLVCRTAARQSACLVSEALDHYDKKKKAKDC